MTKFIKVWGEYNYININYIERVFIEEEIEELDDCQVMKAAILAQKPDGNAYCIKGIRVIVKRVNGKLDKEDLDKYQFLLEDLELDLETKFKKQIDYNEFD